MIAKNDIDKKLVQYLKEQNNSKWKVCTADNKKYRVIVVVPALNESEFINTLLDSIRQLDHKYSERTLFLFVVNNIRSADELIRENNLETISKLKDFSQNSFWNAAYIDAASNGNELPNKSGGVGYARKLGMDKALELFNNFLGSYLVCLDADCKVDKNYLNVIFEKIIPNKISAGYFRFHHELPEDNNSRAGIIFYELFLHYYMLGLKLAGSHFDFHTIGSTIFCSAEIYLQTGGMVKTKAGEDFYFLEKLAKIDKINVVKETCVYPAARISDRVPFGTGAKLRKFDSQNHHHYEVYNHKIFLLVKEWFQFFNNNNRTDNILNFSKELNKHLYQFLVDNNFESDWNNILENSISERQIERQKIFWFDAFKTMKLIHYLRDCEYKNENIFSAVKKLMMNYDYNLELIEPKFEIPDEKNQLVYLEKIRNYVWEIL
ncbi:MAG: glycosyltransferase [Melioribacteraceae bacterium]|nr:glycosyltransferase [Melioribacteraceae bacterium]MCF8355550.1 glycosyltransferase [Melioribacteraceae bacterium]MCF8394225.1 glycosyltransferase [Melioribacteraceae bacterium]MCF8419945.1 glycosyltransferase [Melioribacteraceae bacterium]